MSERPESEEGGAKGCSSPTFIGTKTTDRKRKSFNPLEELKQKNIVGAETKSQIFGKTTSLIC